MPTPINKYKTLRHAPLSLYKAGVASVLDAVDQADSRRTLIFGFLAGGLLTFMLVMLVSWGIAATTTPEETVWNFDRYKYLEDSGPIFPGVDLNKYVLV